ncbi:hypothetical protein RUND412_010301 [Rhizina undulata]
MSTAMLTQPACVPIPTPITAAAGPATPTKKRRRRAPATGAAEDCFTCRANSIKCDRRRPYCGPCLDVGIECRGYRTQLTWGVGVASRGKLRGLSLPIILPTADRDVKKVVKKKEDKGVLAGDNSSKVKKAKTSSVDGARAYAEATRNAASNVGKLSIITSYDFVNMEHPSSVSSAGSRSSAGISAASSAISASSPALSAISRTSMPPQRVNQVQKSPQSSISYSPYPVSSQAQYHPRIPAQQQYQTPVNHYHKSPFSHVSLSPQQPTHSMLLSPKSEYEQNFPSPQHYPMSSAPSNAPLYGMSSASYHPSMTVSATGVSYAPMVAPMHATSRMMENGHIHHHNHHNASQGWNVVEVGVGNLHHQHVPAGNGNLSDLLYDDDMLGTF